MRWLTLIAAVCLVTSGFAADLVPTPVATAGMTDTPPVIDGSLADECWVEDAARLQGFVIPDMSALAPMQTHGFVCWDAAKLYVAARCEEPNIDGLAAQMVERDDSVWKDDSVELFLDMNHDRQSFAHVIVNSIGTVYDDITPGTADWNADIETAASVDETGWSVEMAITFESLGGAPEPGEVWGFNLARERRAGEEAPLSIWSPTYAKFLEPQRFGEILFAAEPGGFEWELLDRPAFGLCDIGLFADRDVTPALRLMRDWPEGLERDWPTPAPEISPGVEEAMIEGLDIAWTGRYRIVDGSEYALVVEQAAGDATLFRQTIPITITPEPRTAQLASSVLALAGRAEQLGPLTGELRALIADSEAAIDTFVQENLEREGPMPQQQWAEIASMQEALLAQISGLSYIVWTQSPLLDLARDQMPPSLKPDPTIYLRACGNELESGAFIVTNLSEELFEGRFTVDPLRLVGGEAFDASAEENLLANGDFLADADDDGTPDGWSAAATNGEWTMVEQPDGSTAFVLSGNGPTSVNFRQRVELKAGQRYTLVAEISAQDVVGGAHVHVINNGWTWSTSVTPLTPTSPRQQYSRSFVAPDADFFQVVLRLDNDTGGTVRFHNIRLVEGGVETVEFDPAHSLTAYQAEYQPLRSGKSVADPLPVMDEARSLLVAPGESRQVFLTLDTATLPPGDYATSIRIRPYDHRQPQKVVPLRLTVLPARLPELMPISVFNWDYARNERYVEDLAEHETTCFLMSTSPRMRFDDEGNPEGQVDWSDYDELLQVKLRAARERGGIVVFSYGIVRDFHRVMSGRHGWEFMSEPWKRAFRAWVLEFERHMRDDIGMDYDEYTVQLWDEATHHNAEMTTEAGHFIREFAPNMSLCMDGMQDPDEIRMLDPVIDVWIPHHNALYGRAWSDEARRLYSELSARGEPVWTYTCSTQMKALDPLDYYRLKEWRVWDLGVEGSCYWAYNSWRGDPWNDFDGEIADCGAIYEGPGEPITSRRWEATRDGREDYKTMWLLREAARATDAETAARVTALIDSLVDEAIANREDVEAFERIRARLLDVVERHCGENPPKLTAAPSFEAIPAGVRCEWETDRPASGMLLYRVPGDADWREVDFEAASTHETVLRDMPAKRSGQWYLLWWDERGATGADLSGLRPEGYFHTGE